MHEQRSGITATDNWIGISDRIFMHFRPLNLPFIDEKNIKFPIMNNIQKILIMVFFISITIFIITASIYASKPVGGGEFSFWQYAWGNTNETFKLHTNWLGMIALGNSVASLVGFFLFKDKK